MNWIWVLRVSSMSWQAFWLWVAREQETMRNWTATHGNVIPPKYSVEFVHKCTRSNMRSNRHLTMAACAGILYRGHHNYPSVYKTIGERQRLNQASYCCHIGCSIRQPRSRVIEIMTDAQLIIIEKLEWLNSNSCIRLANLGTIHSSFYVLACGASFNISVREVAYNDDALRKIRFLTKKHSKSSVDSKGSLYTYVIGPAQLCSALTKKLSSRDHMCTSSKVNQCADKLNFKKRKLRYVGDPEFT